MASVVIMKIFVDLNWELKDTILYSKQTVYKLHVKFNQTDASEITVVLVIYSSYVL